MMENYVGKRLDGRYEIHEVIGVGGMAVVYKAFDNIDKKIVAVKILKEEYLADEEFTRRFKNESKAIAVLSHPNIVKVLDVSLGDRLQYIVMEYVEGITLKEYIQQQGVVKTREALYFIVQILRALQHAHDKGIVHRDIKPQNIMLINDGTIKVTDFGIATFSHGETRTLTDSAIGSVHYISPEQAKGSLTDAKSDIYSAGVVLYELLTGRLPFDSDNAVSVAVMQVQKNPVSPREINADIPIGLEQIILRAMQKNPTERYQSAAEMLVDLREFGRNPNIKFDYQFFVDNQPTKYIATDEVKKVLRNPENTEEDGTEEVTDADVQAYLEDRKKKKKIAAIAGVIGGILLFAVIMIFVISKGSDKTITVPNFVGMNYTEEIAKNKEYEEFWDYIETKFVVDKTKKDGEVISQTPKKGTKISEDDVIILEIASSGTKIPVPKVDGFDLATAQNLLRSEGFVTAVEYETSEDVEEGIVIRTSPAGGDKAVSGAKIIIYLPKGDVVIVPSLTDMTYSEAEAKLKELGLSIDTSKIEYRDDARPKGTIIGCTMVGEEVERGTKIGLIISTGYESRLDVSFALPDAGGVSATLTATVDGKSVSISPSEAVLNGGTKTISVSGSGSGKKLVIYADGQVIYTTTVDFTLRKVEEEGTPGKYTTEASTEPEEEPTMEDETTTKKPKPTEPKTTEPTTASTTEPTTVVTTESTTNEVTDISVPDDDYDSYD